MTHLRKFYIKYDLAFVYNDLSKEFGVAAADIKVLNRKWYGIFFQWFWKNLEQVLGAFSLWTMTRIEMYANNGVLYFPKCIIFVMHCCDINCPVMFCSDCDMVVEAHCLYGKYWL